MKWQEAYKTAGAAYKFRKHPGFHADEGHAADYVLFPKVKTANGLTMAIIKFLTWSGHYANRISTQGQAKVHKVPRFDHGLGKMRYSDQVRFTPGATKRGTPDITAIINGKAVWIEVKIGKDRMSGAQEEQRGHIEDAGGIYFIARDMQEFYEWYLQIFSS